MDVKCTFVAAFAVALVAPIARAEPPAAPPANEPLLSRSHTVAVLNAGIIALPTAPISTSQRGGSTPFGAIGYGDATIETGVDVIFRLRPTWAFGAGIAFGPKPTSDKQYGGVSGLPRTHSRSYLFWGLQGRWVPLRQRWLEGWVGASAGQVVVADRFDTDVGAPQPQILGSREVTIRTEGFATGARAGVDWLLTDHVVLGGSGSANVWLLPSEQACSSIGDCATLSGAVLAFEFGLSLGYRVAL